MNNVSFAIELKDKITSTLSKVKVSFESVRSTVQQTTTQTEKFHNVCSQLKFPNMAAMLQIGQQVGQIFASNTDKGLQFGQAMADLSSITGITGKKLEELKKNAREFGKDSGLGADKMAHSYSVLASQIDVTKIGMKGLNELQKNSITLSHASGMTIDDAALALSGTINQFGLDADQSTRVINVLAAGSKYGAAEINELAQSFKVTGSTASAMGMNVESTAGALEVLSKANLKGSEAGTALRNIILKLNTQLGVDLSKNSLSDALDALKPKLSDATYLSKIFGAENMAAAQFLIQNSDVVDEMTQKVYNTNVATEQANTRTDTYAHKLELLRAQIDDFKIGLTDSAGSFAAWGTILAENSTTIIALIMGGNSLISMMGKANMLVKALTGSSILQLAVTKSIAVATKTWSAVQTVLNAILSANPIGIVVMSIAALASGIIYAYNHFDGFRKVCDKVWNSIKKVSSIVWDYLVKAFEKVTGVLKLAWEYIKKFFGIKDDGVKESTKDLKEQTEAINENTDAKGKNNDIELREVKTKSTKQDIGKKGSLSYLENEISINEKKFKLAIDTQSRRDLQQTLDKLNKEKHYIELELKFSKAAEDTKQNKDLQEIQNKFHEDSLKLDIPTKINAPTKYLNIYAEAIEKAKKKQEDFQNGVGATASAMNNIGEAVGGVAGSWLQYGANIMNTIAQAVPAITTLIGITSADTAVTQQNTTANVANAGSKALKAHASIPFVGVAMGIAAVAGIIAAMASIPKFTTGGIVPGSSFSGDNVLARVNSGEMILNRGQQNNLFNMLNGNTQGTQKLELRARAQDLVCVIDNYYKKYGKIK